MDSLPAEPQGKPKNTGEGSLSILQQIFPTQESNQSLLHCRQILYQLSYQGSPDFNVGAFNIVPEASEIVLTSFNFYFFLSASFISTLLHSTSLILSSASVILLLAPSRVLLISVIGLFIID